MANTSQVEPRFSCFRIFMGHSQIIIWPNAIQYLLRLLFNLDTRASVFASTTNLEAGPRFAKICCLQIFSLTVLKILLFSKFALYLTYMSKGNKDWAQAGCCCIQIRLITLPLKPNNALTYQHMILSLHLPL